MCALSQFDHVYSYCKNVMSCTENWENSGDTGEEPIDLTCSVFTTIIILYTDNCKIISHYIVVNFIIQAATNKLIVQDKI